MLNFEKRRKFQLLGQDMMDLAKKIAQNENIAKLLHFTDRNPLGHTIEELKDELEDGKLTSLVHDKIIVVPKLEIDEDEIGGLIHINLDNFRPSSNPLFKKSNVIIDVLCPVNKWLIEGIDLRIFLLMQEIDKMLNGKALNGIGKLEFESADSLVLTSGLTGYTLVYKTYEPN